MLKPEAVAMWARKGATGMDDAAWDAFHRDAAQLIVGGLFHIWFGAAAIAAAWQPNSERDRTQAATQASLEGHNAEPRGQRLLSTVTGRQQAAACSLAPAPPASSRQQGQLALTVSVTHPKLGRGWHSHRSGRQRSRA